MNTETKPEIKAARIYSGIINAYISYIETGEVTTGHTWVYDHLSETKILNHTKEQKAEAYERAKTDLTHKAKLGKLGGKIRFADLIDDINREKSPTVIVRAKQILLEDLFETLNEITILGLLRTKQ